MPDAPRSRANDHRPLAFGLAGLIFVLDQIAKWIVINPLQLKTVRQIELLPIFNLTRPLELPNVDSHILDPRDTYTSDAEWQVKALDLAARFIKNFAQYADNEEGKKLVAAGPQLP